MIKYLQLYLSFPGGNQFRNGIKKVFELNKLDKSLDSLYLQNNRGYNNL